MPLHSQDQLMASKVMLRLIVVKMETSRHASSFESNPAYEGENTRMASREL